MDETSAKPPTSRCFPAEESELHAVLAHVECASLALDLPRELCLKLCLVVEELFVNTARYGGVPRPEAWVELGRDAAGVWLYYADSAPAFDPLAGLPRDVLSRTVDERPVGGLGRILVADLCTTAHYERQGSRNTLALHFACGPF